MKISNTLVPSWWEQTAFNEYRAAYDGAESPLFFIGSGISRWAGLPNWRDLLIALAEYYEVQSSDYSSGLSGSTRQLLDDVARDPSVYQKAGSAIQSICESHSPELWRNGLEAILDNPEITDPPSAIHDLIMRLRWHRIVTPNYDRLIERAADRLNSPIQVFHPWKAGVTQIEKLSGRCVFKIHGDIADRDSHIVLTEKDYNELYSDHELLNPDRPNIFKRTLGTVLRYATTILFMGYSHDDPYLKDLYNLSMMGAETNRVFALVERSGENFDKRIQDLSRELQIKFISYSGGDGHSELMDFLRYFEDPVGMDSVYRQMSNVRKPTIVMLHCGGTISSEPKTSLETPLSVVKKQSRYDGELAEFSTKLLDWYKHSYNSGNDVDIDIIWEILPKEFQMFSENVTPKLWNEMRKQIEKIVFKYFHAPELSEDTPTWKDPNLKALYNAENQQYKQTFGDTESLPYIRFLSDFRNRYILGIVVLFGTDTLAYLAPALSFSLQHLPCPIVITGANLSPVETEMVRNNPYFVRSDTWKNLMIAMYFLQCFGHRMREIFVCFGNTVHNSVNLRKRSAEIVPSARPLLADPSLEPFTYRNVSPHCQYMFKFIDGLFCNNYYTSDYAAMLDPNIRHIRHDALKPTPSTKTVGADFRSAVQHVSVTPTFPLIDVKGLLANSGGPDVLRAFLVEGYPSGTYPTTLDNNFTYLLRELHDCAIPVLLVSRYGILANQQEYDTIPLPDGQRIPVLYLFGIIAETALPLVSIAISQISHSEWNIKGTPDKVLLRRTELIKRNLADYFDARPDIISAELRNIVKRNEMSSRIKQYYNDLEQGDLARKLDFLRRGDPIPELPWSNASRGNRPSAFMAMSRQDFKLLLGQFVSAFEQAGAAPDGFEVLYNFGFDIGGPLFKSFSPNKKVIDRLNRKTRENSYTLFSEETEYAKKEMLIFANKQLQEVASLLSTSGIGDVTASPLKLSTPEWDAVGTSAVGSSFSFEISIERYGNREREDVKYAVMTFSNQEAAFFSKLSNLLVDQLDDGVTAKNLENVYKDLIINTWQNSTQTIDWLFLGIFKSIACGIAQYFRFDRMAVDSLLYKGVINTLRQAARVNVKVGDEDSFVTEFSYYEKKPDTK